MKVESVTIKNVKSFRSSITFCPDKTFNVLVGSNGSGKSNLMDIIYVTLRQFFLFSYSWQKERGEGGITKRLDIVYNPFGMVNQVLAKYTGESSQSEVVVALEVTDADIANLAKIQQYKDLLKGEMASYRSLPPSIAQFVSDLPIDLHSGERFTYVVREYNLVPGDNARANYYCRYLQCIEGIIVIGKEVGIAFSPLLSYISPFRGVTNAALEVSLATESYYSERVQVARSTSRSTSSLIKLASLYFSEKRRMFETMPGGYATNWSKDPDVQFVSRQLEKIGYTWDISLEDQNKNTYTITLKKDGRAFLLNQASSGEIELINFILGLITMNISNSIVIVDEPELHLHPKWINILRGFFMEYAFTRKNQLMIITHSGSFINTSTYQYLTRVYKDESGSSRIHRIQSDGKQDEKELLHFINATNNEKVFFSDFVVMVEGDTDEVIFKRMLESVKKERNYLQDVEVLQVGGKTNRVKFESFLATLHIPSCFIGDVDNINQLAKDNEAIKALLITNARRVVKQVIKNPSAMDNEQLVLYLKEAIDSGNTDELKELYEYIISFRTKIKPDVSPEERTLLNHFVESWYDKNVFILKDGEIESYFPKEYEHKDLENALKLTQGDAFEKWKTEEGFIKLKDLVELALRKNGIIS